MSEIVASTFVLAVTDLEASKRFYMNKLGFTEDLSVDGWSFLSRGACKSRSATAPALRPCRTPQTTPGSPTFMSWTHPLSTTNQWPTESRSGTSSKISPGECENSRSSPQTATESSSENNCRPSSLWHNPESARNLPFLGPKRHRLNRPTRHESTVSLVRIRSSSRQRSDPPRAHGQGRVDLEETSQPSLDPA